MHNSSYICSFEITAQLIARLAQSVERVTLIQESQGREFEPRIGLLFFSSHLPAYLH